MTIASSGTPSSIRSRRATGASEPGSPAMLPDPPETMIFGAKPALYSRADAKRRSMASPISKCSAVDMIGSTLPPSSTIAEYGPAEAMAAWSPRGYSQMWTRPCATAGTDSTAIDDNTANPSPFNHLSPGLVALSLRMARMPMPKPRNRGDKRKARTSLDKTNRKVSAIGGRRRSGGPRRRSAGRGGVPSRRKPFSAVRGPIRGRRGSGRAVWLLGPGLRPSLPARPYTSPYSAWKDPWPPASAWRS